MPLAADAYQAIITFWFSELTPKQWWVKDATLDDQIRQRFIDTHQRVAAGEAFQWRQHAEGALAEIIVLDQFSRNIFRDQADSFAFDNTALILAQRMVETGQDKALPDAQRTFAYMPYMHSESLVIHEQAIALFTALGQQGNLDYEVRHKQIIERFGRYPHRNAIVGRDSTEEELTFLKQPGSSF